MAKGDIYGCSGGFSVDGKLDGTPGLLEVLFSRGCRKIAHISFAEIGFLEEKGLCGVQSVKKLMDHGFDVHQIQPTQAGAYELCYGEFDAIVISGGNPGVLMYYLRKTRIDKVIRDLYLKKIYSDNWCVFRSDCAREGEAFPNMHSGH